MLVDIAEQRFELALRICLRVRTRESWDGRLNDFSGLCVVAAAISDFGAGKLNGRREIRYALELSDTLGIDFIQQLRRFIEFVLRDQAFRQGSGSATGQSGARAKGFARAFVGIS